jgi:hypothetical protein
MVKGRERARLLFYEVSLFFVLTSFVLTLSFVFFQKGHLPGSIAADLPLWWLLSIGFALFGFIWVILSIYFRKDILIMQVCLTFPSFPPPTLALFSFPTSSFHFFSFLLHHSSTL